MRTVSAGVIDMMEVAVLNQIVISTRMNTIAVNVGKDTVANNTIIGMIVINIGFIECFIISIV